jgi:hypothetical protein
MILKVTQELIDSNPNLFVVKEEVPEYVECIEGTGCSKHNIEGNIYKIESFNNGVLKVLGISICFINLNHRILSNAVNYKSSTKEAYDRQELLKEAKLKYPVGTRYISTYAGKIYTLCGIIMFSSDESRVVNPSGGTLYQNGKWATILQPIFKTQDGVDMYEGDKFYGVYQHINTLISHSNSLSYKFTVGSNAPNSDDAIWFSTKQLAQDYINANKVKTLSDYEDMLSIGNHILNSSAERSIPRKNFYVYLKISEPKLYWTKVLELIAEDLNGNWNKVNMIKGHFIYIDETGYIKTRNTSIRYGIQYFKTKDYAHKAAELMGGKLDIIYK